MCCVVKVGISLPGEYGTAFGNGYLFLKMADQLTERPYNRAPIVPPA